MSIFILTSAGKAGFADNLRIVFFSRLCNRFQSFPRKTAKIYMPWTLTHCILVNSSTVKCSLSSSVMLGVPGYFVALIQFLMENPVSKQCRPWSDATSCGVWSWSTLFAYDPFYGFPGKNRLNIMCHENLTLTLLHLS